MTELPKNPDPSALIFKKELRESTISTFFVVEYNGALYVLKVFHNERDPEPNEFEVHRFQNEVKAYEALHKSGACASGFVPKYYGIIETLDPENHKPWFDDFENDKAHHQAIMLEYLENAEPMTHKNYSKERMSKAVESLEWVHKALVLHGDICPSNVLIVPGDPERVIMTDFDFSKTIVSQEVFDAPIGVGWGNMRLWEWENEMLGDIAGFLEEEQSKDSTS